METLTIASGLAGTIPCVQCAVYVDGICRGDLAIIEWHELPGPRFGSLTIQSSLASRIEDGKSLPQIGQNIFVESGAAQFAGVVTSHDLSVGPDTEQIVAVVGHLLATKLAKTIRGIYRSNGGAVVHLPLENLRFNTDDNHLASVKWQMLNGRTTRVFDSGADACPWSVADALAYVLAAGVDGNVQCPTYQEISALGGEIPLEGFDASDSDAAKVVVELARKACLSVRAASEGVGIVIYQSGKSARRQSIRLQKAGSSLAGLSSNLWRGAIGLSRRPGQPTVVGVGAKKKYECTLELLKGWDPSLEAGRFRDFVRSQSSDWTSHCDVFRKWVLNEHGRYSQSPWNLTKTDFASVSAADFLTSAARKFLPCLSRTKAGDSMGVVIETLCGYNADWQRWPGAAWIGTDECGVYLGTDALPVDYFQTAQAGNVRLRVTATIEADTCISSVAVGDAPSRTVDLSRSFGWAKVHNSSIFKSSSHLGKPAELDDTTALSAAVRHIQQARSVPTLAELTLGWCDFSFRVGDVIDRIDGRGIDLARSPQASPAVAQVRHDLTAQTTHIVLET